MGRNEGCIKLSRKFFSGKMWKTGRAFSEWESWLDLILLARYERTPITDSIGGIFVFYGHGQCPVTNPFLSKRWNWDIQKVEFFLKSMNESGMVTIDKSQGIDVITVCEYDDLVVADKL